MGPSPTRRRPPVMQKRGASEMRLVQEGSDADDEVRIPTALELHNGPRLRSTDTRGLF